MKHDEFRELAALETYGEIDADERARLEVHRAECAECRDLAAGLRLGLGRLASAGAAEDLPEGWADRIRESASTAPRRRASAVRLAFAAGVAAGIAAGFAAAYLALAASVPAPERAPARGHPAEFGRETPPPRAASFGELAHLGRSRRG
jgi:anti-sigma factor RsiW